METRVSTCTHRDMYMYVYYIRASIIHVNMLLADENLHNEKVAQKLLGPQFEQGFVPAKPREFFICHFNRILNTGRLRMHQEWTGPWVDAHDRAFCPMREFLCIVVIICKMLEIFSSMCASVRFGWNACVTRIMRETWQVCDRCMCISDLHIAPEGDQELFGNLTPELVTDCCNLTCTFWMRIHWPADGSWWVWTPWGNISACFHLVYCVAPIGCMHWWVPGWISPNTGSSPIFFLFGRHNTLSDGQNDPPLPSWHCSRWQQ